LPDAVVNRFSIEKRERFWADTLAKAGPGQVVLVGCNECHEVVGFAAGGAERTGKLGCDGELYALYLLPEVQRQRLGTLLFYRLVFELRLRGFHSMSVWVLAANSSRKFYETLGAELITQQTIERGGEEIIEVAYGWSDLARLAPRG
jgi:GNAT superfamily N-acetyltransferase